jgi:DNA invertase Pin-like site-specific DNA recombinase
MQEKHDMSRIAIYARVSTDGQDEHNQLAELRQWCQACGHAIAGEYIDRGVSGTKGADERPELARMLGDAHKRRFDIVLCWALDRLSREGLAATVGYLERLDRAGVVFHSYTEEMLCTDNPVVRGVLLAIMSSMAQSERRRISERTKAGLARVAASGVRLGRKPLDPQKQAEIARLAAEGATAYRIAKTVGCDQKTAMAYMRAA